MSDRQRALLYAALASCNICDAPIGTPCRNRHGRAYPSSVHSDRRTQVALIRRERPEVYKAMQAEVLAGGPHA